MASIQPKSSEIEATHYLKAKSKQHTKTGKQAEQHSKKQIQLMPTNQQY